MILLLFPHRHESELMSGFVLANLSFQSKLGKFDQSIDYSWFSPTEEVENAVRRIRLCEQEIGTFSPCIIPATGTAPCQEVPSIPIEVNLRNY